MANLLEVELVAADRKVWTGEATMVVARTTDGEIGILPGHAPILGILVDGAVQIRGEDGSTIIAAVHGGFLSVADNHIGILAEAAELGHGSASTAPNGPSSRQRSTSATATRQRRQRAGARRRDCARTAWPPRGPERHRVHADGRASST